MIVAVDQTDIGVWGLAASGILVALTVIISLVRHLGIARDVIVAAAQALVQLLLVGFALRLVVDEDDPLVFSWIWLVVMVLFAAWTVGRRAPNIPGVRGLALGAFSLALLATLGVLLGFGAFEPTGRAIVPLAGMVVGNSLAATVLAARRVMAEGHDQADQIEARLALGLSSSDAFAPQLRSAIRDALVPQIERTKAVGIVFLPGAMVGLILAGADPVDAVMVQVAVMYLILGSVSTTTTVMAIGLSRRLFSPAHQLLRHP
ncbi:MAG: ABC transporter permease [Acidimicrobiales bacterium]